MLVALRTSFVQYIAGRVAGQEIVVTFQTANITLRIAF